MAENIQLAILRKKVEGELIDLMVRSRVDNIYLEDGETTLAAHLASMLDGYATEADLAEAIDRLVGGAPETLDTLKEIADWIEEHGDAYQALLASLAGKVDKVEGKGLSTEDFTTLLKEKLEALVGMPEVLTADMVEETADRQFVTQEEKLKIHASARVIAGQQTPADLTDRDLFLQVVG